MSVVGCLNEAAKYECLLFDMDDTLYPMSSGLNLACRKNIEEYMLHYLQIEESEVPKMCLDLYKEYGTTMAGLKALGYEFDNDECHQYIHGRLPYDSLKPDPMLRNLLISMPQRKIIFTNADKAHVGQVLRRLGLEDCFEGVICFESLNPPPKCESNEDNYTIQRDESFFYTESNSDSELLESTNMNHARPKSPILCKPSVEAMKAAIQIANIDPRQAILFDDSTRNIAAGKAAGLHTVIVGSSVLVPGADRALNSIHNIKEVMPEIWEDQGEHMEAFLSSNTVETVVLA